MRPSWLTRAIGLAFCCATASLANEPGATARPPFDPGKAPFAIELNGETVPYRVLAFTALPGEALRVKVPGRAKGDSYVLSLDGNETALPREGWKGAAPEERGLHELTVRRESAPGEVRIHLFVMVPIGEVRDGSLNGYRIGAYPSTPLKGLAIYKPPRGFIEVTEENRDVLVSPNFRLGQFECKQDGGYPRYLVLKPRLLLKLELILEQVNRAGYRCDTLFVMSGYRTPHYNAAIGNVKYSRHVWGGAADIFIDENPRDGDMDDLNRDGKVDYRDAAVLYDLVDSLHGEPFYEPFVGGLGRYKRTSSHGPFVHVDVRGFRARWGT